MIIRTINCKTLLIKSRLPEVDYCINPYIGCLHGCVYCYARFMRRFTKHTEKWGDFLDVKINAPEVLEKELSKNPKRGTVLLGSVTDAYQPAERKYRVTRSVLQILLKHNLPVSILTKSDLVVRDIDVLKQLNDCEVGLTITTLDRKVAADFEPCAFSPQKRIDALVSLNLAGIKTYAFIGPVLPGLTNLEAIFSALNGKVDFVMVEALNTKCGNWEDIKKLIKEKYPELLPLYVSGFGKEYWTQIEKEVKALSKKFCIPMKGFYYH